MFPRRLHQPGKPFPKRHRRWLPTARFTDPATGFSFAGRFGIAADSGNGLISLYLGDGSAMTYRGRSISTNNGSSSQAEVRFVPGEEPDVSANTAITFDEVTGDRVLSWRFANFGTTDAGGGAAPDANPDGDLFDNAQEYILGTNPTVADAASLLAISRDGEQVALEFTAREARDDWYDWQVRYFTIEYSHDLSMWHHHPQASAVPGHGQNVRVGLPVGGNPLFYRLKVWLA